MNDGSEWVKTKVANMVRYKNSGTYFCRATVGGKAVRRSLGTKSFEIAQKLLPKLLERERARARVKKNAPKSVGFFAMTYLTKIRGSGIKPRSVAYREETWAMICNVWPKLPESLAFDITEKDCEAWSQAARVKYSGGRFNGCLETLRGIFREAVNANCCIEDPSKRIDRASVPIEAPKMPSTAQFKSMLESLDRHGRKAGAAFTVRLLAFTGLRVNEARHLQPEDVDLSAGWIHARITKNGEARRVPIISQAESIMKQFVAGEKLIDPRRALKTASKSQGLALTPHDLRHLFATRCIESGADIRTVAGWLGHKDGGALLLRRYAHLRDEHSQRMARKVRV